MNFEEIVADELIEEIAMGPFGSNVKKEFYVDDGIPILNGSNLVGYVLNEDEFGYLTEEKADSLKKANAYRGDVVITHRGTLGQAVFIPSDSKYERYVISQSQFRIKCNEKILPEYMVYFLHTPLGQHRLLANASQVGVPALGRPSTTFRQVLFSVPDIDIQRKIVSVLETFRRKIENNNQINRNLSEQAQAIFKEWFIDNPDSDEWDKGTFSDLVVSTLGGDWGKEEGTGNYTEQVYCVRGADIPEVKAGNKGKMPTRFILPKNYAAKKLVAGDIVVEISGGSPTQSTGRVASVSQSLLDRYDKGMVCTNFCRALKPKDGYSMFIYYYWQHLYDKRVFFSYENGTTGIKNLDINGFLESEEIVLPPKELVDKFDEFCQRIFDEIFKNGISTEKLSELRDSLLPKLMSGELDVADLDI